jgi:predicted  nucleic acid-binding Zn-ribbon protein
MDMGIRIDLNKAKNIAHDKRRDARAAEFAPLDIKATILSEAAKAEAERQKIRDKYDELQSKIDAAETVEELKELLPK